MPFCSFILLVRGDALAAGPPPGGLVGDDAPSAMVPRPMSPPELHFLMLRDQINQ